MTTTNPAQDGRLIAQLEGLYRDPEMRKARLWWRNDFWPETATDYIKLESALGTRENDWLGHVVGFWGMAAALVLQGTLSEQALMKAPFAVEMFEVFCKVRPFLNDLRRRSRKPGLLRNLEELIAGSKSGRQRLAAVCRKAAAQRLAKAG